MFLAKVALFVRKLPGFSRVNTLGRLSSADQLRVILERERGRADRTGDPLSLVSFAPREPDAAPRFAVCLAQILKQRLRSTDEAGWLDDQRIGVVLPSTTADGAWTLADDITLNFPDDVLPPICTVYSYPSERLVTMNGSPAADALAPLSSRPVDALERLLMQRMPVWKRTLDVIGAAAGLIVLFPLFVGVATAIKLTSPGPILFKLQRSGRGGIPFVMYKFRSMRVDAEAHKPTLLAANEQKGPAFKIKDDPRVTALGRFLRRTSLDELPQLWNVLRGDMSLVGPRPLPCAESAACLGWQRRRLDVTPGLTCIWQVSGRSAISFRDWVRMDVRYIRSLSPQHDLKLILLTVPAVVFGKGAY
jgi:lipopolysaccharide/colanic/teichoic acid biosynthesis glycosyltransferase